MVTSPAPARSAPRAASRAAPVVEIPQARHHIMLDQPLALVAALRALLADWEHSTANRRPR